MPTSDSELEEHRWWVLRDAPRHDSGVIYYPGAYGEVWVQSIAEVVPLLVSTSDFAPADMQYRMHRSLLWSESTGLYGERYDVDRDEWVSEAPTAFGNAAVAEAMARALHVGGAGTPNEMRGRWQRETRALIAACAAFQPDAEARALLTIATDFGREDGWLEP